MLPGLLFAHHLFFSFGNLIRPFDRLCVFHGSLSIIVGKHVFIADNLLRFAAACRLALVRWNLRIRRRLIGIYFTRRSKIFLPLIVEGRWRRIDWLIIHSWFLSFRFDPVISFVFDFDFLSIWWHVRDQLSALRPLPFLNDRRVLFFLPILQVPGIFQFSKVSLIVDKGSGFVSRIRAWLTLFDDSSLLLNMFLVGAGFLFFLVSLA